MSPRDPLAPTPYHREVVALLRQREPDAWRVASSDSGLAHASETLRDELLTSAYRLDDEGHAGVTARARAVAERLGVTSPVTLWQAARTLDMNAALCHLPNEAHVVFSGPLLEALEPAELDAILAHELSHHAFWQRDDAAWLVADRLMQSAAADPRGAPSHALTATRLALYTEVVADRGALEASGSLEAAVAALVKAETGLARVSGSAYLRQADEILAKGDVASRGVDHPETFLRARALRLWHDQDAALDAWLAQVIEGPLRVDALDLPAQERLMAITRRFIGQLLRPAWMRTDLTLAHARQFFADFTPASEPDASLARDLAAAHASVHEYLCFLMLDFAAADPSLEELPLAGMLRQAAELGIEDDFEKLALQELKLGKRTLTRVKKSADALLSRAEAAG